MTEREIKSLEFHLEVGDYFATIATMLNLIKQNFQDKEFEKVCTKSLIHYVDEFMYLQSKYKIERK